jgi:glutathione synthase/RimK-type ligase-like ATP-grasp enzyme
MPDKLVVVPYVKGSKSVKALADKLTERLGYRVWRVQKDRVRNRIPLVFRKGVDKYHQMFVFAINDINHPEYTSVKEEAREWAKTGAVVCRKLIQSSEGKGIVIADSPEQVVDAPLYTKYIKKKKEFRVHVFDNKVIDIQEKRKRNDGQTANFRVRNTNNGFVFCRSDLVVPRGLQELAIRATSSLCYLFGAVDIVYNEHSDSLYVLEVNACPGMEGATLENYSNAIIDWYQEQI